MDYGTDNYPHEYPVFDKALKSAYRTGWRRWNAGVECDMDAGPCACGAWHNHDEQRVSKWPLFRDTQSIPDSW